MHNKHIKIKKTAEVDHFRLDLGFPVSTIVATASWVVVESAGSNEDKRDHFVFDVAPKLPALN